MNTVRGLYTFSNIYKDHFFVFKEVFFQKILSLCMVSIQERFVINRLLFSTIELLYQDLFVLCHHLGRYPSVCYVYPILILFQYDWKVEAHQMKDSLKSKTLMVYGVVYVTIHGINQTLTLFVACVGTLQLK